MTELREMLRAGGRETFAVKEEFCRRVNGINTHEGLSDFHSQTLSSVVCADESGIAPLD